ncbi:hypothetical protein ACFQZC_05995 [Streptacidiphilus monticola]
MKASAEALASKASAQLASASASASAVLSGVSGRGNALADVRVQGLPTASTSGRRAVVLHITNSSAKTASYAVQVDFVDSSGKVVEHTVAFAEDVPAGGSVQVVAFAKSTPEQTTPRVAKAERH